MKRGFEVKRKTFFLVSQILSFRFKQQSSKNVPDTTFNFSHYIKAKIAKLIKALASLKNYVKDYLEFF